MTDRLQEIHFDLSASILLFELTGPSLGQSNNSRCLAKIGSEEKQFTSVFQFI